MTEFENMLGNLKKKIEAERSTKASDAQSRSLEAKRWQDKFEKLCSKLTNDLRTEILPLLEQILKSGLLPNSAFIVEPQYNPHATKIVYTKGEPHQEASSPLAYTSIIWDRQWHSYDDGQRSIESERGVYIWAEYGGSSGIVLGVRPNNSKSIINADIFEKEKIKTTIIEALRQELQLLD